MTPFEAQRRYYQITKYMDQDVEELELLNNQIKELEIHRNQIKKRIREASKELAEVRQFKFPEDYFR